MKFRSLAVLCGAFVLVAFFAAAAIASAQAPAALPTAPGAGIKAAGGGYTGAKASLPGENGSPLEPYLFLVILAGGGIVAWVLAIATDVSLRKSGHKARR